MDVPIPFIETKRIAVLEKGTQWGTSSYIKSFMMHGPNGLTVNVEVVDLPRPDATKAGTKNSEAEGGTLLEAFTLPTGKVQSIIYRDKDGGASAHGVVVVGAMAYPKYSVNRKASGAEFKRMDHEGHAGVAIAQSEFMAATNTVIGPYDPEYMQALGRLIDRESKGKLHGLLAGGQGGASTVGVSLNILTDGKASLVREIGPHGRVLAAYVGKEPLTRPPADTSRVDTQTVWAGNGFDGRIQDILEKTLPKNEATALIGALSAGRLSLRVEQANNGELCSAMLAKAKKDEQSQCHKR